MTDNGRNSLEESIQEIADDIRAALCACGHPGPAHDNKETSCDHAGCGCTTYRPKYDGKLLISPDMFMSLINQRDTYSQRADDNYQQAKKLAKANKEFADQERQWAQHHEDLHQTLRRTQVDARAGVLKVSVYSSIINMLCDAGRMNTDLMEVIDAGLSNMSTAPEKYMPDVKFFVDKNPLQGLMDFLTSAVEDDDEDDVVDAHICESDDCNDPSHIQPYDNDHEPDVDGIGRTYQEYTNDAEDDGPTGVGGYVEPLPVRTRPVKDDPQG